MSYQMSYDDDVTLLYSLAVPEEGVLEEPSANPIHDLLSAKDKDEVLMNPLAKDRELYFAFLQDVTERDKIPLKSLGIPEIWHKANTEVIKEMYRCQVDYERIMRIMTVSYEYPDAESRWTMASVRVANTVNPILNEPWTAKAKPLVNLRDREKAFDYECAYYSFLKAVWDKDPSMRLAEAERKCVVAMEKHYSEEFIRHSFREHSLQFPKPEPPMNFFNGKTLTPSEAKFFEQYNRDWEKRTKELNEFIDKALTHREPPPPNKTPEEIDAAIYKTMQEDIRKMKSEHETGDLVTYWQKAIDTMKDAFLQVEQAQNTCKILALWSIGLERAAKELGAETHPELKPMTKTLSELMVKVEEQEKNWEFLYQMAATVDNFSRQLLKNTLKKRERSPLLKLPEIQHAKPLQEVIAQGEKVLKEDFHRSLYLAAVKEAAFHTEGLTEHQADNVAAQVLQAHKVAHGDICRALIHSPRIEKLSPLEQISAVSKAMRGEFTAGEKVRGGGRT